MAASSIFIETPRLLIRELLPEDMEGMYEMDSDPEVHRYVGQNPVTTREQSLEVIEFIRRQYEESGIGRWGMILKETGAFVGWLGFKLMLETVNGHTDFYDFGYRLARRYWGKGLATEGARAALQYGIQQLGINAVYAMTDLDNGASRHILESLGFRLQEIFAYDAAPGWRAPGEPTTWYQLDMDLWRQQQGDAAPESAFRNPE